MTCVTSTHFLDCVFTTARTHRQWLDRPVPEHLLRRAYEIARMGPTAFNANPLRIVFVASQLERDKLVACLSEGNRAHAPKAPVIAIFATDHAFTRHLHKLAPRLDAQSEFADPAYTAQTAIRSATLQAAYFMIVARGLGLDCGPMSGFDNKAVDKSFLDGSSWRSNFICALGYGSGEKMRPRQQRLSFEETCRIV